MKLHLLLLTFVLFLFSAFLFCNGKNENSHISIIPKPQKILPGKGVFELNENTVFVSNQKKEKIINTVDYFNEHIHQAAGFKLKIDNNAQGNYIELKLMDDSSKNPEAYDLRIQDNRVVIRSNGLPGLFYGINTLLQLCPAEYLGTGKTSIPFSIPQLKIEDSPRFAYRGTMLDVSRHFFPKDDIIKLIDMLAFHKINHFHWHLVDDQGWRIEIKKYPRLTEIGAWRVDREDRHWNSREARKPGEKATYGGFYTQEEIKEIVAYAEKRHITIIPEIEMPAHVTSALAAYPQLSCTGGPFTVVPGGLWPITDIYCAGNDEVFEFLEGVLSEVFELFPGEYIHIGGDEAAKDEWEKCPKCQKRMKDENLKDVHELQSYFVKRMEKFIHEHDKKLIGWDEIVEGGLPERAIVMSWRGMENGIEAAKKGYHVIMSPTSHCYLDYYQGDPAYEPLAIGGYVPVSKTYSFQPVPDTLPLETQKNIMGPQVNLWTEYVPDFDHVEYMYFPRVAALSEVAWSLPEHGNFKDFSQRLLKQFKRYDALEINYAKSLYQVTYQAAFDSVSKKIQITLKNELDPSRILYTLDGSDPNPQSTPYIKPITIDQNTTLKAAWFDGKKMKSKILEENFKIHKGLGKEIKMISPPSPKYPGSGKWTLLNCLRGTKSRNKEDWLGFEEIDFEAVVDLKSPESISKISVGFLNSQGAWIFLPKKVEFYISNDNENYEKIHEIVQTIDPKDSELKIVDYTASMTAREVRYIKIKGSNIGKCPQWHQGAGDNAWLFADEIVIE